MNVTGPATAATEIRPEVSGQGARTAPSFEVIRRPGEAIRPERDIGSGMKQRINGAACVRLAGIHFVTDEPLNAEHAERIQGAVDAVCCGLRAAGWIEVQKGARV